MKDTTLIVQFFDRFGFSDYEILQADNYDGPSIQVIRFVLEMKYKEDVSKLAKYIKTIQDQEAEDILREKNPTLKRAYDDYKLLLKLSK